MRASLRRAGLVLPAILLAAGTLPMLPPVAAAAVPQQDGFSQTKTLLREFDEGAEVRVVDERRVTVRVDSTQNLQGRERIRVSWTGAHPSGGRASNPFGEAGLNQEYPVVIMQCRGLDDPSLPVAKRLRQETCWTSTKVQRSQVQDPSAAIWIRDLFASEEVKQVKSGLTPYPAERCEDSSPTAYAHVTAFVAAGGEVFPGCTSATMPPEAAVGSAFPPAEQAAFTGTDGTGETQFEVRSEIENESLGCSRTVACSLVVIPIMGLSCAERDPEFAAADRNCRRAGQFLPGTSNFAGTGVDDVVSPVYWWAESNWKNRFSVPLSFGLPPSACDILDSRAPTPFFGSELLSQAATQWAPAYCLRRDRFKWQANSMSDDAAFAQMINGDVVAAQVSGARSVPEGTRVGYAPTAVSGFAISYVLDRPENRGEVVDLKLNARLLAKLLSQSYPASGMGTGHPGLERNPLSINRDPEFIALNPGVSQTAQEAGATLMALSNSADVMESLTAYIARDREAVAFLNGTPDRWGMSVNPFYKGITVPVTKWPLLDTYIPPSNLECQKQNPAPYLSQVAAPVSSLRQIASAVLDAWPLVQTSCTRSSPTDPFKLGRVERQGVGSRLLFGITTLGDAERFGLRTASLKVAGNRYVAPSDASMAAAVALAKQAEKLGAFEIPGPALAKSATAYPGTMIVYTAARLSGLPKADAAKVAQFIEVSSTEGQRRGRGNGQLPDGYLPILPTGATQQLLRSAGEVARAVRLQKAAPEPQTESPGGDQGPGGGVAVLPDGVEAPSGSPVPGPATEDPVVTTAPVLVSTTTAASSTLGNLLLPLVLLLGFAGALLAGGSRFVLWRRGVR